MASSVAISAPNAVLGIPRTVWGINSGVTEATDSNRFLIGRNASSTAGVGFFAGRIRRPLVARKALTDPQRAAVEAWVGGAVMTINGRDPASGAA